MSAGRSPASEPYRGVLAERLGLVDAVDHLLDRGAVVVGDATLSLGGVDLVYLGLNLVVSSVEALERDRDARRASATEASEQARPLASGRAALPPDVPARGPGEAIEEPSPASLTGVPAPKGTASEPVPADQEGGPERGLARLVLTIVELLRQVLERQAVRRMEGGRLSEEEVERMGVALKELETKMAELRDVFGLSPDDLDLDLGPLGRLL